MLSVFIFILSGVAVGYLIRNRTYKQHVGSVINIIIIVLLFFLGVAVGGNKQIAATLGSILCAWFVFYRFFKNKENKS